MATLSDRDLEEIIMFADYIGQIKTNSIDLRVSLPPENNKRRLVKGRADVLSTIESFDVSLQDMYDIKVYPKSTLMRMGVECQLEPLDHIQERDAGSPLQIRHTSYAFNILVNNGSPVSHMIVRQKDSDYMSEESIISSYGESLKMYRKPENMTDISMNVFQLEPLTASELVFDDDRIVLSLDTSRALQSKKVGGTLSLQSNYPTGSFWKEIIGNEGEMELEAGRLYLFSTKEVLNMRNSYSVSDSLYRGSGISGKYFRGVIDCGFVGSLTIPVFSEREQVVSDGQPAITISIDRLLRKPRRNYGIDYLSNYQMSLRPKPSKIFV